MQLMSTDESLLLVVDLQEKLLPAIHAHEELVQHCVWLIRLAKTLQVPIFISEQYPQGLGPTASALKEVAVNVPSLDKTEFSCVANSKMLSAIEAFRREQVIIGGIETHVCVLQTAIELANLGKQVFVVTDATNSRNLEDKHRALERMAKHPNIQLVTREMVLFEWLQVSGTGLFKEVSKEFLQGK